MKSLSLLIMVAVLLGIFTFSKTKNETEKIDYKAAIEKEKEITAQASMVLRDFVDSLRNDRDTVIQEVPVPEIKFVDRYDTLIIRKEITQTKREIEYIKGNRYNQEEGVVKIEGVEIDSTYSLEHSHKIK